MRTFSDPANHCDRSPDNPAQPNDNDRKGAQRAAQTSATKKEVRAAAEALARPSVRLRDKKSTARRSASCDKKWHVPLALPWPSRSRPGTPAASQFLFRVRAHQNKCSPDPDQPTPHRQRCRPIHKNIRIGPNSRSSRRSLLQICQRTTWRFCKCGSGLSAAVTPPSKICVTIESRLRHSSLLLGFPCLRFALYSSPLPASPMNDSAAIILNRESTAEMGRQGPCRILCSLKSLAV